MYFGTEQCVCVYLCVCVCVCVCVCSEQLCVSDLAAPRRSLSGEDLPTHHQTAYSQDREQPSERPRGQTEPGRDIELELSVLDLEDSDAQPVQSQVS